MKTSLKVLTISFAICSTLSGCGAVFSSPEGSVERAFSAYKKGDNNAASEQMSPQGLANSALFCGGQVSACLAENYRRFGANASSSVATTSKTESSAKVILKTTWTGHPTALCQAYTLDNTKDGWKITYFDVPRDC